MAYHDIRPACDQFGAEILAAIESFYFDWPSVKLLLEHDDNAATTEDIVVAYLTYCRRLACSNYDEVLEVLRQLLSRRINCSVNAAMLLAAQEPEHAAVLLDHPPRFAITSDIVETHGYPKVAEFLLRQQPTVIPTESIVIKLLGPETSIEILELMWSRNPNLQVTRQMLEEKKLSPDIAAWLLTRADKGVGVNEK